MFTQTSITKIETKPAPEPPEPTPYADAFMEFQNALSAFAEANVALLKLTSEENRMKQHNTRANCLRLYNNLLTKVQLEEAKPKGQPQSSVFASIPE